LLKSRRKKKKTLTFETTKLKNKTGLGRQVSTFEHAGWRLRLDHFSSFHTSLIFLLNSHTPPGPGIRQQNLGATKIQSCETCSSQGDWFAQAWPIIDTTRKQNKRTLQ
jgi:hypothetical protein